MSIVVTLALRRLRAPLLVLIGAYSVSILVFTLLPGVDDTGQPWHMDFFHAFYFVSYMATTIGFGELPHEFTSTQRLWTTASLYLTVFAWLYTIGSVLNLVGDPAFKQAVTRQRFVRAVKGIREPFYIVCGYGDTGRLLTQALTERGLRAVVIDTAPERVGELSIEELGTFVAALQADAGDPSTLSDAGLENDNCLGIIALSNHDQINLKIAITAKLLNPRLSVVCRANSHETEANMKSFGTDHVVNPFDSFADHLAMAIHSPSTYLIYEWLTSVPHTSLSGPLCPPRGTWVICGYGRLGKAVERYLNYEGVDTAVIEQDPQRTGAPDNAVTGRATEAVALRAAHIDKAAGVVAGTNDDADNLSIIMTAQELNPSLFRVARQNRRDNEALFRAAELDIVMQRSDIIAHKILAFLTTPVLADFLRLARHQRKDWADQLLSRMAGLLEERVPDVWAIELNQNRTPALLEAHRAGVDILLAHLIRRPRDRARELPCIPLLFKRGTEETILPEPSMVLQPGDLLLFCGQEGSAAEMDWTLLNWNVLRYIQTGQSPRESYIWRWLARQPESPES